MRLMRFLLDDLNKIKQKKSCEITYSILLPVTVIQNRAFLIKTNDILNSNNDNVNGFYQMIFGHDGGRCQQTILCVF